MKIEILHGHTYIENEILVMNNDIIHQIVPGEGHIVSSIPWQKMWVFVIPRFS